MPGMDGSQTWQESFEKRIAELIWIYGFPIRENANEFEWKDLDAVDHQRNCSMVEWSDLNEDTWYTFTDTDHDGLTEYGCSMLMSCACGIIDIQRVRLDMPVGRVILRLLNRY